MPEALALSQLTASHVTRRDGSPDTGQIVGNVKGRSSTAGMDAIVHFGSVGRLCGLFERSKAT